MKIAYLILAHRNPVLIKKAMDVLACDGASFFIHIDAKVPLAAFDSLRGENVTFCEPRLPVYWGEISLTDAIFTLMRQALASPQRPDYFVLMSGSDFPLRSGQYIQRFLKEHRGREFVTLEKLPAPGMPMDRITTRRFPSTRPVLRFAFRALAKFGLATRDHRPAFRDLEPYSGHTWWTLSRRACQYVLDYVQSHPELSKFFEDTHASDESFIQTILANAPFKSEIRRHLVYEEWRPPSPHPEMITMRHVAYFESQDAIAPQDHYGPGEMLFARKFSDEMGVVDRVVAMIHRKEKTAKALAVAVGGSASWPRPQSVGAPPSPAPVDSSTP